MRVLWLFVVVVSAGCFDNAVAAGARVTCIDDGDCPTDGAVCRQGHCTTPGSDIVAPGLVSLSLVPAHAARGARVSVVVTADEDVDDAQVELRLFQDGNTDVVFVRDSDSDPQATHFAYDVPAEAQEQFIGVREVVLVDVANNARKYPIVDGVLHIDPTPPSLTQAPVVTDGEGWPATSLADTAGNDTVVVQLATSEDLRDGEVNVDVGGAALSCAFTAFRQVRCEGSVAAASLDGPNPLAVTLADAAGNRTLDATTTVIVDKSPPRVEDGTVVVDALPAFTLGSRIALSFVVSEPVAAPPVVELVHHSRVPLVLEDAQGRYFSYSLVLTESDFPVDEATATIEVSMTDLVAHEAVGVQLPLPPPFEAGLPLVRTPGSPCTIAPDDNGNTCTDADADGQFGHSVGCHPSQALDCDDTDPTTYLGAVDLPGDGRHNGCLDAPDTPLDEAHVVFADSAADADQADGSRAHPFVSLEAALAEATSAGQAYVVMAAGAFPEVFAGHEFIANGISKHLIGGRNADDWESSIGVSTVFFDADEITLQRGIMVQGVATDVPELVLQGDNLLDAVQLRSVRSEGAGSHLVRVDAAGALRSSIGVVRVTRSQFFGADIIGQLLADEVVFRDAIYIQPNGGAVLQSCAVITLNTVPPLTCDGCRGVEVYFSVVDSAAANALLAVTDGDPAVTFVANALTLGRLSAMASTHGRFVFAHNAITGADAHLFEENSASLDSCDGWPIGACERAEGNIIAAPVFDGLAQLGAREGEDRDVDPVLLGAPTSSARDPQGQCRYSDGTVDIGPDEAP